MVHFQVRALYYTQCNIMIILIPIGGVGQRFKDSGYKEPKALIRLYGKTIISHLLDNLNTENIDYIFIPYNKEYSNYRFEDLLTEQYPEIRFRFHCLKEDTRGAADTIRVAIGALNEQRNVPVLCLDCDAFYHCDITAKWNGGNCVFSFKDSGENPVFSYVEVSGENKITDIREKEKISDSACSGAYGFESINELSENAAKIIDGGITQKSEFYTSGVIKQMLAEGKAFNNITVESEEFTRLGIPEDVERYCTNIITKNIESAEPHVFDINGHSSFSIDLINIHGMHYLCKSSKKHADSLRLHKQIEKQENHQRLFNLDIPSVVFKSPITDGKAYIIMDYLGNSSTCFTYIVDNNHLVLDRVYEYVKDIIDKYIRYSAYKRIDQSTLVEKTRSIKENIEKAALAGFFSDREYEFVNQKISYLESECGKMCSIKVPIGYCHGDLTLSNTLFDLINNKVYLIDFLDSFIETPLFDMIKIRQDTKFFWSLKMCNLKLDTNKTKIAFNYLDKKLDDHFKQYEFYNSRLYNYFETMNLLRVLQYCKSQDIKEYLLDCLHYT